MSTMSVGQEWIDRLFARKEGLRPMESEIIDLLLFDHTTRQGILWCTDDYKQLGCGFSSGDSIVARMVTGDNAGLVRPRAAKTIDEQRARARDKAEVFTPSWICNAQNNLIDNEWFGRDDVFNRELTLDDGSHSWQTTTEPIAFPEGKTWCDYVNENRMEIACGEAPYIASLYDAATGEPIAVGERIGLLDRKLRIVSENVDDSTAWLDASQSAFMSTYGYEWQGDNLLLARKNLVATFIDHFDAKFHKLPMLKSIRYVAYIVSWNIWQMDGLKGVVPNSCGIKPSPVLDMFAGQQMQPCQGCKNDDIRHHNGTYCLIKDWGAKASKQKIRFIDLIK